MQSIVAEKRDILGKKTANLRKKGLLPAVVYGKGSASENISVKEGEFMNHLFQGLLAVDHTDVFNFFASGLKDEIGERNIRRDEFFYQ